MKRPETARRNVGGVKWDEPNLALNEVIKSELNAVKIDEPKTPYHGPLSEAHMEDDDLQHLNLDGHANGHEEAGPSAAGDMEVDVSEPLAQGSAEGRTEDGGGHGRQAHRASDPQGSHAAGDAHDHGSGHGSGWTSSGASSDNDGSRVRPSEEGDSASSGGKQRDRFAARRAQHYNMRDALARARELLSSEEEACACAAEEAGGSSAGGDAGSRGGSSGQVTSLQ